MLVQQESQVGGGRLGTRDRQEHDRLSAHRAGPPNRILPAMTAMPVNLRPGRCVPLVREGAATWVMKEANRNPVSGHEPLIRIQRSLASTGRGGPNPSHRTH